MDQPLHLLPSGREDARMVVAGIDDRDPGEAVEVVAAPEVGQRAAAGCGHRDRLHALGDHRKEEPGILFKDVHETLKNRMITASLREEAEETGPKRCLNTGAEKPAMLDSLLLPACSVNWLGEIEGESFGLDKTRIF